MLKSYVKIAWRNLTRSRSSSLINIGGLAVGMAVALLIGLWVHDELSFNKYHEHYDRIARVMQNQTSSGKINTYNSTPIPLGKELQDKYGPDLKYVVLGSWDSQHILSDGDNKLTRAGIYMDKDAPAMLSLKMLKGNYQGLKDPHSILLSAGTAKAIFGDEDPMNRQLKIDNRWNVKVTGVYENLPQNSQFTDLYFIAPWDLYVTEENWVIKAKENAEWNNSSFQLFVQLADRTDLNTLNKKIVNLVQDHVAPEDKSLYTQVFLFPMRDWHLRSHWENGRQTGGLIEYVWLFSLVAVFVLILACINFMNLSTARSEKRAREVGIRKAIGSLRGQLIGQFYSESMMVVLPAFLFSLLLVQLILPWFNQVADKDLAIPWLSPVFWGIGIMIAFLTGIIAGSYPALYLSSFQPISVLKGTFRAGRLSSIPRKILVVFQFTTSLALIIGTIIVFEQVQYSRNRPIGYDRNGLMMIRMKSKDFYGIYGALKTELKNTGAVTEMSEASSPMTDVWSSENGFEWEGKNPNMIANFNTDHVTPDFGKTVSWTLEQGRDFSDTYGMDSSSIILNEAAVKFMGIKDPVGMIIRWGNGGPLKNYQVVGVVKDILAESPYDNVRQTAYFMNYDNVNWIILRLNPGRSARESIAKVETVFKKLIPASPFDYQFASEEFAAKFATEDRIGKLSTFFAALAIFISCMGLFGLASFVAEQRTKEIGIRKVLGATVTDLWRMMSGDFVILVLISCLIAMPVAWYFMSGWLQKYDYHTGISWWIFAVAATGAIMLTLFTVSFQAIKAALINPAKSLKAE